MIPILMEEPHFLVVDKPAGWLCQAPAGVPSLQRELVSQLKIRDEHPGQPFIGLPHRLDRSTTGTLLIAPNHRALKRFNAQFQSRKIGK
ncbi:MAG: RNA pseudouridine synthase, partial [Planctomycetota bacterium]